MPKKKKSLNGKIVNDLVTGLPVLSAGDGVPILSSKQVDEILMNFP